MNYYILDSNNEIALFDIDKSKLETTLKFMPQYAECEVRETEREIVLLDGKYVFADEHVDGLLAEAKSNKLAKLDEIAVSFEQNVCKDMIIKSSLGWRFDADLRSQNNVKTLLDMGVPVATYRDADNEFHELTAEQMIVLKTEMAQNGLSLYQQKWTKQAEIVAAANMAELDVVSLDFIMMDFTPKTEE